MLRTNCTPLILECERRKKEKKNNAKIKKKLKIYTMLKKKKG
jgi:hypothetical protein